MLTGCQDKPRSYEFYQANLDKAQQDVKNCQQMRDKGKEPNDVLSKNCRIASDVLRRRANAATAAAIKNS